MFVYIGTKLVWDQEPGSELPVKAMSNPVQDEQVNFVVTGAVHQLLPFITPGEDGQGGNLFLLQVAASKEIRAQQAGPKVP
jgi:hypothetical protein